MFGNTFYHASARKLILAFASVFNNIHVQRKEKDGTLVQDIKVPLAYESQKKYLARLIKDTAKNRQVPRMGFVMSGIDIDIARSSNQMNQIRVGNDVDTSTAHTMYSPVPYNYNFTLDIYCDYMDDGLQIIEQILPYFQPDFNVVIEEMPDFNITRDIPIELISVNMEDEYEGDFGEHRIVNWSIDFVMKGWMYPPITDQKVIKEITTQYKVANSEGKFDLVNGPMLEQMVFEVDPTTAGVDDNWVIKTTRT